MTALYMGLRPFGRRITWRGGFGSCSHRNLEILILTSIHVGFNMRTTSRLRVNSL